MKTPIAPQVVAGVVAGLLASLCVSNRAHADQDESRFEAAGYFRVMTRPDFQGGNSKLGYSNLYGRLLNEGPYAALEMRLHLLAEDPKAKTPWTRVHAKVEGGSIANVDSAQGNLGEFRLSQLYAQAGNVLLEDTIWQLGTLTTYFGDVGLYDARLAQIFDDTVGLSARYRSSGVELLLGIGDAGFALKGDRYNSVLTAGGTARVRLGRHLQLGLGGQVFWESTVEGNRFAPHDTPGITYEDVVRGEVVQRYVEENPGMELFFPRPVSTSANSAKLVAYVGFGDLGPLLWNSFYANFIKKHPDGFTTETFGGESYDIYLKNFTDERYQINVGNEAQLSIIPNRLDLAWAVLVGHYWNRDNNILAGEDNRTFFSTVLRMQYYVTPELHLLVENSLAREKSKNGNLFRNHVDSVFQSTNGISDARGLEFGDSNTRDTWQGKIGWVLSPLGSGIYTRPSLRLLYGIQHSTQTNAFGNSFVETLDDFSTFDSKERHLHHVLALEAETWF